jgi:hypothetical protein
VPDWTTQPALAPPEALSTEEPAATAMSETAAVMLDGRILVRIAPVPDFDRLLNLDGALGRMERVRNVTLADYTKEEVTFRVELTGPISDQEFSQRLAATTGYDLSVLAAEPASIDLRLSARS